MYKRSLLNELILLQKDSVKLMELTEGRNNLYSLSQGVRNTAEEFARRLEADLADTEAETETEPEQEWKSEDVTRLLRTLTRELRNPLEPIRSYALSRLEHVIRYCNEDILKTTIPEVVAFLKTGLNDKDPYVYLAAVSGITVVASRCGNEILPLLLEIFSNPLAPLDLRLKISEAIVCTVHYLGRASVKYAPMLMKAFLGYMAPSSQLTWKAVEKKEENVMTAKDEVLAIQTLRATCYSSISEIVSQIKYSMGPYIPELLTHCRGALYFETKGNAVLIRRAAVYLLYSILQGADEAMDDILENQVDFIYQILRHATNDNDDIVRGHANACLQLLSSRHPIIEVYSYVCN